jgi:putative transposase
MRKSKFTDSQIDLLLVTICQIEWSRSLEYAMGLLFRGLTHVLTQERQPFEASLKLNHVCALDFMRDTLYDGRPFRTLNVIDEGKREALRIECGLSIRATRLIRTMNQLIEV